MYIYKMFLIKQYYTHKHAAVTSNSTAVMTCDQIRALMIYSV